MRPSSRRPFCPPLVRRCSFLRRFGEPCSATCSYACARFYVLMRKLNACLLPSICLCARTLLTTTPPALKNCCTTKGDAEKLLVVLEAHGPMHVFFHEMARECGELREGLLNCLLSNSTPVEHMR